MGAGLLSGGVRELIKRLCLHPLGGQHAHSTASTGNSLPAVQLAGGMAAGIGRAHSR